MLTKNFHFVHDVNNIVQQIEVCVLFFSTFFVLYVLVCSKYIQIYKIVLYIENFSNSICPLKVEHSYRHLLWDVCLSSSLSLMECDSTVRSLTEVAKLNDKREWKTFPSIWLRRYRVKQIYEHSHDEFIFGNRFASNVYRVRSFIEIINREFNEKITFNLRIGCMAGACVQACMCVCAMCVVYELEYATHPMCILST